MQKNEIPIIIDFIYTAKDNLLIAATSNKKLIFWSLHIPSKFVRVDDESEYYGDMNNRFYSKVEYIYSSNSSISSLFLLKKYNILVLTLKEKTLTFHKIDQTNEKILLKKIGFLEEENNPNGETHSDVIMCVEEIWKSGYIVTGGLDGRIKAWDARGYCNKLAKNKEINKVEFEFICDLSETELDDVNLIKRRKSKNIGNFDQKNLNPQVSLVFSSVTNEGKKGIRKFSYSEVLGGVLLSLGFERDISVWSPDSSLSKAFIGKLQGHSSIVQDVKFIPGTLICISVDKQFSFRVWDVRKLEVIQSIKEET